MNTSSHRRFRIFFIALGFVLIVLAISLYSRQASALCELQSEVCVEPAETRIVNGLPVTRDCWRYAAQYTCSGNTPVPEQKCQDLIDQGCSPVSQECDQYGCTQTYECPVGTGTTQVGVGCENQSYAIGGMTFDTSYPPSSDFGKAASNMAAVESAVTGMIKNDASCIEQPAGSGSYVCAEPIQIFTGEDLECRKDQFGFNKCCDLSGWGVSAGLNQCTAEEHKLGYARQDGRTHRIGKYCAHTTLGGSVCTQYRHVYCAFNSKIGRIVQEQGRLQLGIGWGSTSAPNCRGFTEAELQAIDFDLIDFSEYFADAFADMANPPSNAEMQNIIDSYINTLQNSGCSQFDPNYPNC